MSHITKLSNIVLNISDLLKSALHCQQCDPLTKMELSSACEAVTSVLHRELMYREQMHREQMHREQMHREQMHREQMHREQMHREQMHREQMHREQINREQINPPEWTEQDELNWKMHSSLDEIIEINDAAKGIISLSDESDLIDDPTEHPDWWKALSDDKKRILLDAELDEYQV